MLVETIVGIVFGVFFGIIFVVACIVSAIKAVRDRSRIKRRIVEKERIKEEAKVIHRQNKMAASSIEEKYIVQTELGINDRGKSSMNGRNCYKSSASVTRTENVLNHDNTNGMDNLTYVHSHSDVYNNTNKTKSKQVVTADRHPHKLLVPSSRTLSGGIYDTNTKKQLTHLPKDCLAVQKILRRHSYEIAVCENSWLPMEPPMFASSSSIIHTYNFGHAPNIKSSSVGFINKAYDKEDHKKT